MKTDLQNLVLVILFIDFFAPHVINQAILTCFAQGVFATTKCKVKYIHNPRVANNGNQTNCFTLFYYDVGVSLLNNLLRVL